MSEHPIHIPGDSVWNEDTEQCEAAPTVAPEPTTTPTVAPEPTTTEDTLPNADECFRDNTAYYGHNINNPATTRTQSATECQNLCRNWTGGRTCRFWSWEKTGAGRCYIKKSMEGQEYAIAAYGDVFPNNNNNYASGTRDCNTVVGWKCPLCI